VKVVVVEIQRMQALKGSDLRCDGGELVGLRVQEHQLVGTAEDIIGEHRQGPASQHQADRLRVAEAGDIIRVGWR